jgi:hypothetical protein
VSFKQLCQDLEQEIQTSYEQGVSMVDAERLAGKFLAAQIKVSDELRKSDLDARLRKSGVKAIRAAIYLDIVQKSEKKPTETGIAAMVDSDDIVKSEQEALDKAEVERDYLERYYNIFINAHQHYRNIAKGGLG